MVPVAVGESAPPLTRLFITDFRNEAVNPVNALNFVNFPSSCSSFVNFVPSSYLTFNNTECKTDGERDSIENETDSDYPDNESNRANSSINTHENVSINIDCESDTSENNLINDSVGKLKCLYSNADQLRNKIDELETEIMTVNPDLIFITEVLPKVESDIDCSSPLFNLTGYTPFPSKNSGRGVLIYAKNSLNVSPIDRLNSLYDDSSWCSLLIDKTKIILGSIYRSPSDIEACNIINNLISEANSYKTNILITGDFNMRDIDWTSWSTCHSEQHVEHKFIECLRDNFIYQHIQEPTRFRENQTENVLDLILTKDACNIENLIIEPPLGLSDHATLIFDYVCPKVELENGRPKYKYTKCDVINFANQWENIDWPNVFSDLNLEQMWKIFSDKYISSINEFVPKIFPKPGCKKKPLWMTFDCLSKIKRKKKAWARYLNTRRIVDLELYKTARNQCTDSVRLAKKNYEKLISQKAKTEPKHFWTYVRSKTKTKSTVSNLLKDDGSVTATDKEKATLLNDFFASVFTKDDNRDAPVIEDREFETPLNEILITQDIVEKYLLELNGSKSMGPDDIHPYVIKSMAKVFATPITLIFQKSLETGKIPTAWKDARVTPIFKNKGSKSEASNYRPVSLTSVLCKTLEKVIRKHILNHLTTNNLLSDAQFGFRNGRSCILQLLDVMEDWSNYIDNDIPWDTIYLDFAKAFDKVSHRKLLTKLNAYGIRGNVLSWIKDFLLDRRQQVSVKGEKSEWQHVLSGVPQGSVLGPILFIIFINDIPEAANSIVKIFADDTKLYAPTVKVDLIQDDLNALYSWSNIWDMKFNVDKCKTVHYGRNNPQHVYTMNNIDLQEVNEEKDLGIIFQNDLKFSQHISGKINKANSILGLISRTFCYLDRFTFLKLYTSLVRPHIEYGNTIWYPHLRKDIDSVEKVQKRATKLLPEINHLDYVERLRYLKLPSLVYRRRRLDMIQTYKIINKFEDIRCERFFTIVNTNTRGHSCKLSKPRCNSSFRLRQFSSRIINDWNNLPESVISAKTVENFKMLLDRHWDNLKYQL